MFDVAKIDKKNETAKKQPHFLRYINGYLQP